MVNVLGIGISIGYIKGTDWLLCTDTDIITKSFEKTVACADSYLNWNTVYSLWQIIIKFKYCMVLYFIICNYSVHILNELHT